MHAHRPTSAVACLTAAGRRLGAAVVFAVLAALTLPAAPEAQAQTARTVTVTATSSGGATLDAAGNMSVNEGETISASLQLDAALTDGLILVNNAPFGGTATNGTDYTSSDTAAGGVYQTPSYTFSGTTVTRSATSLLVITDDNAAEGAETITWTWAIDSGSTTTDTVTLSHTSFTITIRANDGNVFSIAANAATAAEDVGNITFTVTMLGVALSSGFRTVNWTVGGAGITAGDVDSLSG
ncbi:MAG: hypothetical protein OXU41_00560, partial [Gammaproteobacteria bacterium]|nr:hypothetical protein [Gammaproteobacteria bacterium]